MIHGSPKKQSGFTLKFTVFLVFFCCGFIAEAQTVDCSVSANCSDPYCQFAANIEKGCNCFDNVDNDGDGKADKADSNCATYYGMVFVGEDADCSIVPPGVNTPFDLVNAPITSSQNTADTQSKISVGDIDGDGIPDAVITSKWNSEFRVVATASGQADGTAAGDVKSSFNLTSNASKAMFNTVASGDISKLKFEHENLIADIDGDGIGELYGVASLRGAGPTSPPTRFYLVGFNYAPDDLDPMFNAIDLGTNRPGTFGIADMDGDGKAEIYLRDRIYAAETGALLATGNGNWDLDVTSGPVAVNITGDDKMELVCGTKIYSIPSFADRNPAVPANLTLVADMNTIGTNDAYVKLAIDPVEYGTDTHSMCSVADIDRDGNMDVVISGALNSVSGPTAVFYWNVAKGTVSHYVVTDPLYANGWPWGTGRVNLGDANGDGKMDLTFIAGSYLHSLTTDASGNLVPLWPTPRTINDTRSGVLTVSIYDFNNDGDPEVVYRDSQELVVVDGATGQTKLWSAVCQSHTYTEGPVIADVNGDGATDICVSCNTSNSFNINAGIAQQALGQFRLYFSSGNEWLPTRKVWNQPGYYVVNVNDDLTLPFPQLDQNLVFGDGDCLNGLPGPQMPLNVFMNQVPYLAANGCPVYPAPDLSFVGDNPDNPGVDENGDGVYSPTVEVIPPICGDLAISVRFNIINDGDLPITANIPVSFFIGDPTDPSITSDSLIHSASLPIANLEVDSTYTSPLITFNGTGSAFRLYIVLNNDGTILPIDPNGSVSNECRIDNNIYSAFIQPDPFTTKIEKIKDNFKCENTAPDNGELRVRIFKLGVEVTDYSQYAFQWYTGTAASYTAIAGATNYNLLGLPEGDYTAIVTNTAKGCVGLPVDTLVVRQGNDPEVVINVISHQTVCDPPNGELEAVITGGNTGYTFEWLDGFVNPIGVSGPVAKNLFKGNYTVRVSKDGCSKVSLQKTVDGPVVPDAQASTLQNIVDCSDPNTGSITATPLFNGAPQDPANYSFDWYFYANGARGGPLPAMHGSGPTRTLLPVGQYQVVVTDLATKCESVQMPITEITSEKLIPTAIISELAPLTSCDLASPNGRLSAAVEMQGVAQDPSAYTFEWFKGSNTLPANAHADVSGTNGSIAENVAGGGVFYTVRVTTGNNCTDTDSLFVSENLNVPIVTLTPTDNGICDPALATSAYNGTVTASVTFDGVAVADFTNYQITWHNGSLDTDPVIAGETSTFLDERNGGYYTAVVERTDLGCTSDPVTAEVVNAISLPVIQTDSIPSTNCVGGTPNGGVTVTSILPADTYSYRWFDPTNTLIAGATTGAISGRQGGVGQNYTVEVTLGSTGCRNTFTTGIPDNKLIPVLALTPSDNSICDGALGYNGAITSTFTDTNALAGHGYTYVWSTGNDLTNVIAGQTGSSITQRNGGFYTATIRNTTLNCTSSPVTTEILNNQILPAISAVPTPSTNCPGGADNGAITASVTNGLAGQTFTFAWSKGNLVGDPDVSAANGGNTATIINQQGNQNYIVLVTNNQTGCQNTFIQAIADNSVVPVLTLLTTDNSICDPLLGYNGTVSRDVITDANANGTDTYSFVWSAGNDMSSPIAVADDANPTLTGQNGGFYTATVANDRLGCVSNPVTAEVNNNQILPAISAAPTPSTNCPGGADNGAITASVTNGLAGQTFTFAWSKGNLVADPDVSAANGGNTATIINQQGNQNYIVLVTNDQTGCQNTFIQTIADNSMVPVLTLLTTDNSICDPLLGYNGTVSRDVITDANANGTDTYSFVWSSGNDMTSPIAVADDAVPTLGGRNGGFYSVTVTNDRLGCVSNPVTAEVNNNQILPAISAAPTPSTNCPGGADNGAITASVTNGLAGQTFTFAWSKGNLVADPDVSAANGGNTATIINQQGSQNYIVLVTNDQTGCANSLIQTIADNSIVPALTLITTDNSICDPLLGYNGTVSRDVITDANANGTDTYSFVWSSGNDMSSPIAVADDAVPTLGGRNGGFYSVTVTNDRLGCVSNPVTAEVNNNQILPAISAAPTPSTNCPGGADNGAITASVTNGLAGQTFTFAWSKGNLVTDPDVSAANGGNTATIINQQGSQNYIVLVTNDQTGCANSLIQTIADNSIVPALTLITTDNSICDPLLGYNGTVSRDVITDANANGTDTYSFVWSSGNDMSSPIAVADDAVPTLGGRNGGFYSVTVTNDRLGCVSNPVTAEVNNNQILPAISAAPTPSTNCPGGADNGAITASVTNPVAGQTFTFAWSKGNLVADPDVSAANGGNTATIINQQGNQNYIVLVTNDQTGCANTLIQTIADNREVPVLSLITTENSICDPALTYNGTVAQDVLTDTNANGTDTYSFVWSNGNDMSSPIVVADDANPVLIERNGGFYTVTVTNDRLNCTSNPVTAQVINNQILPAISTLPTASTNCAPGTPNGEIAATVTNPLAGQTFTFQWYEGNTVTAGNEVADAPNQGNTNTAVLLQGGFNFTVHVRNDQTGCENLFTQALADISELPTFSLNVVNNEKCVAPFDGSLTIAGLVDNNSVGADTYNVTWYDANVTGGPVSQSNANIAQATLGASSARIERDNGFYTVVITNNRLGCTSSPVTAEVVDDLEIPAITTSVTPSTNCVGGTVNGAAAVTGILPADVYEHRWYAGVMAGGPILNAGINDVDIDALQGGATANYTVEVVRTTTGCTSTATVTVLDDSQIPVVGPLDHADNINCTAPFNGTATVPVNAVTYRSATINDPYAGFLLDFDGVNADNLTALAAGTYSFTITHIADNCISNPVSVTVLDDLTNPVIDIAQQDQTSCDPANPNGQLTATVAGGVVGHSFQWFRGIGTSAPAVDITDGVTPNLIDDLASDDYTGLVTNTTTRCASTVTVFLPDNIVNPSLSFTAVTNVTSCAAPNGDATPLVTNVTTPPNADFTIFYIETFAGNAFPTDPALIKSSADFYSSNAAVVNGTNPPVVTGLSPGYLTGLIVDNYTSCESSPVTVQIDDATIENLITLSGTAAAGFCGGVGGGIEVNVAGGIGPHTFEWHKGTPTNSNINFYNNPPVFATPVIATTEDLGMPGTPPGVDAGSYTVVVVDAVGCGAYFVDNVPFAGIPTVNITKADVTKCDPGPYDGAINVTVTGTALVTYDIILYEGNNPDPLLTLNANAGIENVVLNTAGLQDGQYLVRVIDNTLANINCPLDYQRTLLQNAYKPIITIDDIVENTACDDTNFADGEISLTARKDALDTTVPAYSITSIFPAPLGFVAPMALGTGVSSGLIPGFAPVTYTITVTDANSGCVTETDVTIPDQPVVPQLLQVDVTPETFCAPQSSGSAEVTAVNPVAITDYQYTWYSDAALTAQLHQGNGGTGGEIFDESVATYPAGTAGQGYGNQTVYVRGERLPGTGPGVGCPTPAVTVVIKDEHVTPVATLATRPNTSCDPLVGEGSITITAETLSSEVPVQNGLYTYLIAPDPNAIGADAGNTGTVPFIFGQLVDDTYTVTTTNDLSGCQATNPITIQDNKFSLNITQHIFANQLICNPDGDIDVTEIVIDRTLTGEPNQTFAGNINDNFNFEWFRAPVASPGTFNPATPLTDPAANGSDVIATKLLTGNLIPADGQYETMGAGTYYVIATRKGGGAALAPVVGFGCETPPLRVDIQDQHVNPVVTLLPFSDTSCNGPGEGSIEVDVTDASAVAGPFTYGYAWTTTGLTPPANGVHDGINNLFTPLDEGDYTNTVTNNMTGCTTSVTTTIFKNVTPIFVTDINVVPQFYCDPSGRLEVTGIEFEDRNGNTVVPPIADFAFSWTRSGVGVVGTTAAVLDSTALNYPGIGFGQYSVFATRTAGGPGFGCASAPINLTIEDKRIYPVLTLTPFSNTSCAVIFEGAIEVDVSDASVAKVPPVAASYDYTWSDVNAAGLALPPPQANQTGLNNLYTNLEDGTYQLDIVSNVTGCTTQATTTIIKNQTPVFLTVVNPTPQFYCDPSGKLEITGVTFNDRDGVTQNGLLTDFSYTWMRGGIAAGDVVANTIGSNPRGAILDSLVYAGIGFDPDYYVVATRTNGTPGAGCSSAPIKVEVVDKREYPVISLTPFSNTSCTTAFEGEIEIDITDASQPKVAPSADAGQPILYDYTWADVNTAGLTLPPNQAGQTGLNNLYQDLEDGTYRLTAVNTITGCSSASTTTIIKNQTPVFLTVVNPTPQFYCEPSGRLEVTGVTFTDRNGANQIGSIADFTFDWARGDVNTPVATTIGSTPRGAFLDSLVYAGIGYDPNYYVVATRTAGSPGAGCASAPIKVEIVDKREYPVITLTPFSNTSCTTAFEGEIEIDITDASEPKVAPSADAGQPILYDYTWADVNTAGLTLPPNQAGQTGLNNLYQDLEDGTYRLTAVNTITGCSSSSTTTIIKNQTPVFLTVVNPTPQFYCEPSGRLEVTGVTFTDRNGANQIGSIADFTFDWARGDVNTPVATTVGSAPRGNFLDSLVYAGIGYDPNYYVVATRTAGSPGAGCASAPIKIEIVDKREYPVITLTPFSNTSCTTAFEGEIEIDITDASEPKVAPSADAGQPILYDYTWADVNTAGLTLPPNQAAQTGLNNLYQDLEDGTYRLTAVNTITGCSSSSTTTIIKNQTPVFLTVVNPTPQFYCEPSGRLEVTGVTFTDRNGANQIGSIADFRFDWARGDVNTPVATTVGSAPRGNFLDSLVYAGIGYDPNYYVVATRTAGSPGAGCASAPIKVEIVDKREYPVITLTPFSNTSCTTAFEGEIEIDIADTSEPKVAPSPDAGQPFLYDYTWTDISGGLTLPPNQAAQTGLSNLYQDLGDGTYRLTAVNTITGCSSESTTTIIKNQTPIFVQDVDMIPQLYCGPSGHLEVRSITYNDRNGVNQAGPLADFTFAWTRNDLVTVAGNTDGSMARGTFLDSLSYTGAGDIGFGTYYVVATRNAGTPGAGCESAPFKMDITDKRENPVISFTTLANTSCDNNFDGRITVISNTSNAPGAGANYDILWTSVPAGNSLAPATDVGPSYQTPLTDIIGPGSFTVQVTNRETNCASSAVVTMISNPQPVEILTVNTLDQMICFPDGSITVSAVSPAVVPDYSFNWFRNDAASPALQDAANTTIISSTLDNTNYPTIGADTYFVVGQKLTALGSGCVTPPFRVNIQDLHVDPNLSFTFDPNSSCNPLNPNGQLIATAVERDGTTDDYSFAWTLNAGALPAVTTQTDNTPLSRLDDAFEGQYTLVVTNTITGCDFTSGVNVNLDHNVSLPNIITVDTFDPLDCLGSGSAEVTSISIGGGPSITGPVLDTDFQYEWYQDDFVPANQLANVDPLLPNLNPGRYFVRVQDLTTDCKSFPTEVAILEDDIIYPVVTISQTALQISCVTTDGTAGLLARGDGQTDANANYQFAWFNNLDTTAPSFATTSAVNDLLDGEYSVLVTNSATGCSADEIYVVRDDSERFMPVLSLNTEGRIDCVTPDGNVQAREVGFTSGSGYPYAVLNFTTEIYPGANADVSQPGTAMIDTGFPRNWLASNLDVGSYTVKLTDNNTGCFVTGVEVVADNRVMPVIAIVQDNPLINCDPALANGQLSATADGGKVGGFQFDWYGGTTASGSILSDNNKLVGLGMGDYTVRVTNNLTHCFSDAAGVITDGRLYPPVPTTVLVFDRTRCDYPDGWVTANVGGVTFNYSFDWYDGTAVKPSADFNGVNYINRDIGLYTVTARDEITGCISNPASIEVKDLRVIPEVIVNTTPSFCEELPGSVGGTGTAEIQLQPADVVSDEITWSLQPNTATIGLGSYLTNILPGFYQADVVTSQGCVATGVGEVKTEVYSYNLVSSNGDQKNDNFRIDCITQFPNNNVKIFNRSGVLVYEADGYDNNDVVFTGVGEKGVYTIGNQLPVGTYFFIIDKRDGSKPKTGYLELVK